MQVICVVAKNPIELENKLNELVKWRLVTVYKDKDMLVAWLQAVE